MGIADAPFAEPGEQTETQIDNRIRNEVETIMSTSQGRLFMWRLLRRSGLHRVGIMSEYACGKRDFGIETLNFLAHYAPENYRAMIAENGDLLLGGFNA